MRLDNLPLMLTLRQLALLCLVARAVNASEATLESKLAVARPGQTVELPAGEFKTSAIVPAGVTLKGAGYDKTSIDAGGAENGLVIASGATVSDLAVRGAKSANVLVRGAEKVTVQRVRASGGLIGLSVADARGCRIENVISDGNRYGIVVTGGDGNAVVNCSLVGNASLGLSFPAGKNHVAFNNLVAESATAIYIGTDATGLTVDHNLYFCLYTGKYKGQLARKSLFDWSYLSGQDAHSVSLPMTFAADWKPTNALPWAQDRAVTSGWGASEVAGQTAPAQDIAGQVRPGVPGLGAFEVTVQPSRPADAVLDVPAGDGVVSAGVFTPQGKLITYLFNDLPLRPGKQSVWLPARSDTFQPIAAGEYELRAVRAKLKWDYVGVIGNTSDRAMHTGGGAPPGVECLDFDQAGHLIIGRGHSEEHVSYRSLDGRTGAWRWYVPGASEMTDMAVAQDGLLYSLRVSEKEARITRHDPATGKGKEWKAGDLGQQLLEIRPLSGMTLLDCVYVFTETVSNAVWFSARGSVKPVKQVHLPSPTQPVMDAKARVVWVKSGEQVLMALATDGSIVATAQPVADPLAIAARDGRLAVASAKTGKVHLFDASNPKQLKEIATIGKGDGPAGAFDLERFRFQDRAARAVLALGPDGLLAVADGNRVMVFDKNRKPLWRTFAIPGSGTVPSNIKPGRLYAHNCTLLLDTQKNTWEPETFSPLLHHVVGDFQVGGKTFVFMNGTKEPGSAGDAFEIARFEPAQVTLVARVTFNRGLRQFQIQKDQDGDGTIDDKDKPEVFWQVPPDAPIRSLLDHRFQTILPDGTLIIAGVGRLDGWFARWPCAGLDDKGVPIYRIQDKVAIPPSIPSGEPLSVYDGQPDSPALADIFPRADGGYVGLASMTRSTPGKSLLNNGGSEIVGFSADGQVMWAKRTGAEFPRVGGLAIGKSINVAGMGETANMLCFNDDGLGLGGFSMPEKSGWEGFWLDHSESVKGFTDEQGRLNMTMCDYINGRNHWFRLVDKQVTPVKVPVTVSAELATALAALPAPPPITGSSAKPATPRVLVAKLAKEFSIDGDMEKWRKAGIQPQIILTPETSAGIEAGARDASALVRLAYHGQNLYVQVMRFDDVITTHQPTTRAYLQDTVEMCVNGYYEGIKFNMSMTSDKGAANIVDGWDLKARLLDPAHAPLAIKTLDNAEAVPERQLIENIFGLDMRRSKVQVFEAKLPIDKTTYAGVENRVFELKPGGEFWLGFLVDDNDEPGTDVQNFLFWPVTYGTFSPKETGALAVLD